MRAELVLVGAAEGLVYGLLAAGLVLAFRASRVVNLAHGQVGAFAAALMAVMVLRWDAPYWSAFLAALAAGAVLGAALELSIVRRLRRVPPLMTLVATLGAAQVLQFAGASIAHDEFHAHLFPQPAGVPSIELGDLTLPPASVALLVLGPLGVAALVLLKRGTTFGLTLTASCDEPDAARALGIPARRYVTAAWALAGGLSALTAVLVLGTGALPTAEALGPSLLLRALAAAVIARMTSLSIAVVAGVALGVAEQGLRSASADPGVADVLLLLVIAGGLVAMRPPPLRRVDPSAWLAFEPWSAVRATATRGPLRRWGQRAPAAAVVAVAAAVPLVAAPADEARLAVIACATLVAISVWLVAALGGELSLGQFAIAGVGAAAAAAAGAAIGNTGIGLVAGAAAGAALGALLAAATSRSGGLGLAVLTLAFAIGAESWIFRQDWMLGTGVELAALRLGPLDTASAGGAYLVALVALVLTLGVVRLVVPARAGRRLRAMRDNAPVAQAYGVDTVRARIGLLAGAGALAAVAGTLLAHVFRSVAHSAFPVSESIDAMVVAVVGGLAVAWGPVLGALAIGVLPAFVDFSAAALAATATGWLALLLYAPGGLAAVLRPLHERGLRAGVRIPGEDGRALVAEERTLPRLTSGERPEASPEGTPAVRLEGLGKGFGAVAAVADVDLDVRVSEIVAIVGPNGAGKTTLLDLLSGLQRPDSGRVLAGTHDVTRLPASTRPSAGIARSFQDGALFPTLTVEELVRLGADAARAPGDAAGRATEMLTLMGLASHAGTRVRALSTGMRRIAELAAMLAMRPRVLLLDEPSAGLAAPEVDSLAALLLEVRDEWGTAMLLVEHDWRLVAAIADRVVVMEAGRIVAGGTPHEVLPGAPAGTVAEMAT